MTTYHVEWGADGAAAVSTPDELDTVLGQVTTSRDENGHPFKAGIFAGGRSFGHCPSDRHPQPHGTEPYGHSPRIWPWVAFHVPSTRSNVVAPSWFGRSSACLIRRSVALS